MRIDHIAIWTSDLEQEKQFFLKYFDCRAGNKYINPVKGFSSYFIEFESGSRIELMHRDDISGKSEGERTGLAHFAIDMGSREIVGKLTILLESDGFAVKSRPRVTGDGYFEAVIMDPEKNIIELLSR